MSKKKVIKATWTGEYGESVECSQRTWMTTYVIIFCSFTFTLLVMLTTGV